MKLNLGKWTCRLSELVRKSQRTATSGGSSIQAIAVQAFDNDDDIERSVITYLVSLAKINANVAF